MQSGRFLRHLPQRRCPQFPPSALCCDPLTPIHSTGGPEGKSHPLVPYHVPHHRLSSVTANGLTGAPSLPHLHLSLLCRGPTPLQPVHLFPHLSTAAALCTETGSSTRPSVPKLHLPEASTPYSTRTSHTWGWSQAEKVGLLAHTHAQGRRRSTAGVSRR